MAKVFAYRLHVKQFNVRGRVTTVDAKIILYGGGIHICCAYVDATHRVTSPTAKPTANTHRTAQREILHFITTVIAKIVAHYFDNRRRDGRRVYTTTVRTKVVANNNCIRHCDYHVVVAAFVTNTVAYNSAFYHKAIPLRIVKQRQKESGCGEECHHRRKNIDTQQLTFHLFL